MKSNLVNLLAFYSKLEYTSTEGGFELSEVRLITIENNILAAEFIKNTCQLW